MLRWLVNGAFLNHLTFAASESEQVFNLLILLEHGSGQPHLQIRSQNHQSNQKLSALGTWLPAVCFPTPKRFRADAQLRSKLDPRFPGFQPKMPNLVPNGYERLRR